MNVIETASRDEILKFKIACKSDELTNEQIDYMFVNFEIEKETEIEEILNILCQYRKDIYDKYEKLI